MSAHNIMRIRFPNLQDADLDVEDDHGNIVPGAWRDADLMQETQEALRAPRLTRAGKVQRIYLKHYYKSDVGSVPWQEAIINM